MHATSADQPPIAAGGGDCPPNISVHSTGDLLHVVAVTVDATESTVQVQGELDMATGGLLDAVLEHELQKGHRFVRLDLSGLSFIDCAGLGVVVSAHNRFLAARGTIVLTGQHPAVTRLLDLTELTEELFVGEGPPSPRPARHLTPVPVRR